MNFLWFLGLVCVFTVVVQSQNDLFQAPKRGILCGEQLANALSSVCGGNYNKFMKKAAPYNEMEGEAYDEQQADEPNWPFLSPQSANALLTRNYVYGRYRRGVVDECCRKPCSYTELTNYCSPPSS